MKYKITIRLNYKVIRTNKLKMKCMRCNSPIYNKVGICFREHNLDLKSNTKEELYMYDNDLVFANELELSLTVSHETKKEEDEYWERLTFSNLTETKKQKDLKNIPEDYGKNKKFKNEVYELDIKELLFKLEKLEKNIKELKNEKNIKELENEKNNRGNYSNRGRGNHSNRGRGNHSNKSEALKIERKE